MSNFFKIIFWSFHPVLPSTLGESKACGEPVGDGTPLSLLTFAPWAPGSGTGRPSGRMHTACSVNRGHEENLEKIISFSLN